VPRQRQQVVEVLNVARATEALTGEGILQINFGQVAPISDELRAFLPVVPGGHPPKTVQLNTFSMFYKLDGECPYKVGSKWKLSLSPDGSLELRPVR
jgi:hypothetical protein